MKKCTKCGIEKPLTAEYYNRNKSVSTGFRSQCKACKAEYRKNNKEKIAKQRAKHYQNNKEKILEEQAEYRKNNREKILKRKAEYYQNNKEKIREQQAEYQKNNREKVLKRKVEYYQNNKEKLLKRKAEYRKNNREKIAEYRQNNRERLLKQQAKYRQNNREILNKKNAEWYQNKKAEQPGCVYQIVNSVNDKIYIGETTRGEIRWKQHLWYLRGNYHPNCKLQADFNKFGEEAFSWNIIQEYPKNKHVLLLEEIRAIDRFLREGKELYNLSLTIDQLKLLMEEK